MEYSLDGVNWNSYDLTNKPTVNVNPGSNIYLRGTNFFTNRQYSDGVINFNKDYNVCGNFMSVSNYSTMNSVTEIQGTNAVYSTFYGQTHLISAADLNFGSVTTLTSNDAFRSFFGLCSSLIEIPDFSNITSVASNSLSYCFYNCTSLESGADFSNITSVGTGSFSNCYSSCIKISNVTAPNVQDLTQNNLLQSWLTSAGVQATGTKVVNVPTGATIATDSINGIPTGWTRVDY